MSGETRLNPAVQNIRSGGEIRRWALLRSFPPVRCSRAATRSSAGSTFRRGKRIFSFAGRTVRTTPRSSTAVR